MGVSMILKIMYMAMQSIYKHGVRSLIKEAISDPNSEWDESVMAFLDRIFDYQKSKKGSK